MKSAPERDFTVDVDAMLAEVDERARVVFIANPANPTGTCIPFADIKRLHARLPEHVLLVLDGAYAEFARGFSGFADGLELARQAPNVLVTRTFSKLHGLASLRIGWGYASTAIADTLNRIRLPFNASTPALAAALAALGDEAFVGRSLQHAEAGRSELAAFLTEAGLTPLPSATNFVTARVPETLGVSARDIEAKLAEQGVLVRGLGNYAMPDALRITVGDAASMQAFRRAVTALKLRTPGP